MNSRTALPTKKKLHGFKTWGQAENHPKDAWSPTGGGREVQAGMSFSDSDLPSLKKAEKVCNGKK